MFFLFQGKELKGAVTENVELKLKVEYVKTMEVELKSLTKSLKAKDAEVETLQRQWEDSSTLLKERVCLCFFIYKLLLGPAYCYRNILKH